NAIAKKIIFQPQPHGRLSIFQAKEIEMVNGQSSTLIFMHDRKSRAGYCGIALEGCDESLRKQGLAAAEFAFESQHGTSGKVLRNSPRNYFRFSSAVGNERSHGEICDFGLAICD